MAERGVALLPAPRPPARPRNRLLALRTAGGVQAPLAAVRDALFIFDALYPDWDSEYLDAASLDAVFRDSPAAAAQRLAHDRHGQPEPRRS